MGLLQTAIHKVVGLQTDGKRITDLEPRFNKSVVLNSILIVFCSNDPIMETSTVVIHK